MIKHMRNLKEDTSIMIDLQILVKRLKVVNQKLTTVFTTKCHYKELKVVAEVLSFYSLEGPRVG